MLIPKRYPDGISNPDNFVLSYSILYSISMIMMYTYYYVIHSLLYLYILRGIGVYIVKV